MVIYNDVNSPMLYYVWQKIETKKKERKESSTVLSCSGQRTSWMLIWNIINVCSKKTRARRRKKKKEEEEKVTIRMSFASFIWIHRGRLIEQHYLSRRASVITSHLQAATQTRSWWQLDNEIKILVCKTS